MEVVHFFLDLILHLDVHLAELIAMYGVWVYAILFLIIFAETGLVAFPFLPGDSLLFIVGAFAAAGKFDVALISATLFSAAVIGDSTNYVIGRYFGMRLFSNPNSRIFKQSHLKQTHEFFERHGGRTLIMARFVPIVRTFAPFVAGLSRMTYLRFLSYSVGGGFFWVGSLVMAGYLFGNLEWVKNNLTIIIFGIIGISLLPAALQVLQALRKKPEQSKS